MFIHFPALSCLLQSSTSCFSNFTDYHRVLPSRRSSRFIPDALEKHPPGNWWPGSLLWLTSWLLFTPLTYITYRFLIFISRHSHIFHLCHNPGHKTVSLFERRASVHLGEVGQVLTVNATRHSWLPMQNLPRSHLLGIHQRGAGMQ